MEEKIRQRLEADEQLLWCGKPEAFEMMDKTNKRAILAFMLLKIVLFGGTIVGYLAAVSQSGNFHTALFILFLLVAGWTIATPFQTVRTLRGKAIYALTDKRLYRIGTPAEGVVDYDTIREAALRSDADGHLSLLCGVDAVKAKPWRWRDMSLSGGFADDAGQCVQFVLYALPRDEKLLALLNDKLPL